MLKSRILPNVLLILFFWFLFSVLKKLPDENSNGDPLIFIDGVLVQGPIVRFQAAGDSYRCWQGKKVCQEIKFFFKPECTLVSVNDSCNKRQDLWNLSKEVPVRSITLSAVSQQELSRQMAQPFASGERLTMHTRDALNGPYYQVRFTESTGLRILFMAVAALFVFLLVLINFRGRFNSSR